MMVVLPFCAKDAVLAEKLLRWISELGGVSATHRFLLLAAKAAPAAARAGVMSEAKNVGCPVEMAEAATSNEHGWPEACNHLFYSAAARMEKLGVPFLWLEPDCVPLRKTWLDEIAAEYIAARKPYLGFVFSKPWPHLTGCAVYPAHIKRFNSASLRPERNPGGPLPWDVVSPQSTLTHTHRSELIFHEWGEKDSPPTFKTVSDAKHFPERAVLYHRCKDGTLIDRLRERRTGVTQPSLLDRAASAISKIVRAAIPHPKVDLLYICVRSPSEPNVPRNFQESHERFVRTYKQFKPTIPHRLLVACYNGERDAETDELFAGLNPKYTYYNGTGFDIGTYLHVGGAQDSDFILCCGSNVHFWRAGWLERMVEAWQKHGDGAYAPMASYEGRPHLRTCCVATSPKLLRQYPHPITSRQESYDFESGAHRETQVPIVGFTQWVQSLGRPTLMVMRDGELAQPEWRKPPNIFRRGDQSNCIIWDRHTLVYAQADENNRRTLSRMADGGREGLSVPIAARTERYKTITVLAVTSLFPEAHAEAINRTVAAIPHPCKKLLLSPTVLPGFDGEQQPLPEPWAKDGKWTIDDMAQFILSCLYRYIDTDVAILVHADGYALNRSKWTDDFLLYDYIGAPWPRRFNWVKPGCRVGNGGFSLRSKQWLERASTLPPIVLPKSEDVYTSIDRVQHFTHAGCRIAPLELAMRWSLEHVIEEFPKWTLKDSFGFHGLIGKDAARKHLRLT